MASFTKIDSYPQTGPGHGFIPDIPSPLFDTFTNTRYFTSFDLSGYSGGNDTFRGTSADGIVIRSDVVLKNENLPEVAT